MPMIESAEGVANAEEIIGTNGVDGIFIGPVDLRHSLGFSGPDGTEPEYLAALQKVLSVAGKFSKPVGILGSPESMSRLVDMGFKYVMLGGGDAGILGDAATALLNKSRHALGQ